MVLLEFLLFEILLERVALGHEPVPKGGGAFRVHRLSNQCGNHQESAGVAIGIREHFQPFGRIFDDIEDIAEIDDISRALLGCRTVDRVPPFCIVAESSETVQVGALAAAVIEDGCAGRQ